MAEKLVHTGYANYGDTRYPIKVYVTYSSVQGTANENKSTVTCGMKIVTNSNLSIGAWVATGDSYVGRSNLTFSGAIPNFSGTYDFNGMSRSFEVKHNEDGTASTKIYWKWGVNSAWGQCQNPSGEFDITLPTIARYPVLSLNTATTTLNTLTCNISNTRTGTMEKYQVQRISDGVNVVDTTCNGSFSFTLTGLTPNTDYSGKYKVRAYANGGWGDWLTITSTGLKTTALPTVSTTANVGLENANKIQFTNLNHISSYSIIGKTSNDNTQIYSVSDVTTNNYEFTLTSTQRTNLLKKYTNATKPVLYFEVSVVSNGTTYRVYNTSGKNPSTTYTIPDTTTYQPTFATTNLTNLKDLLNTSITGDATKFIINHNKLQGTIAPMTPKLSATGKSYGITAGTKKTTLNYSSSNQNFTIDNVDGNNISVIAIDSRDKSTTINTTINMIPYTNPSIDELNIVRQNGTGTYAVLEASGKYTNWSGLAVTNKIKKIEYRWKLASDDDTKYSSWINITGLSNSNGDWFVSRVLDTVFNNTLQYHIQIRVTDELEVVNSNVFLLSTADVFIWKDLANKRMGIGKKPEKDLDVDGEIACLALYINGEKVIWEE